MKVEMRKVESFLWNNLSNKSSSFESEYFLFLFCCSCSGGCTDKIQYIPLLCCKTKMEFSRKVEMRKVESFYWNKLSNKSFSFESELFFDFCFVFAVQGFAVTTSNIYHY